MIGSRNKKGNYYVIIILLLVGISLGYAVISSSLNIVGSSNIEKNTWDIHFENIQITDGSVDAVVPATIDNDKINVNYEIKLLEPGDFYEFKVNIVNNGSIDAMLSQVLKTGLDGDDSNIINYSVTYEDDSLLAVKDLLLAGNFETVKVRVEFNKDIDASQLPTSEKNLSLSFGVIYVQNDGTGVKRTETFVDKISEGAVLDSISSTYVSSSTGINFSSLASDTNGKGLYIRSGTESDTNPIYYYRGDVDNNNVKFANFCWKIVRTTETGGIKLIYNGLPDSDGYCTNTGEDTQIGTVRYNGSWFSNYSVGYMYGNTDASTYEEVHANINDSDIKTYIDNWYETNMLDYTSKLEDTVWCNDRSISSGTGIGGEYTEYGAYARLGQNKSPSLSCPQAADKFTVSEDNGNGKLTYPVALITADEVFLAGGTSGSCGNDYYLETDQMYWTLTPYTKGSSWTSMFEVSGTGCIGSHKIITNVSGVRPSVSLLSSTKIVSGDGTSTNPYVVG